MDQLQTRLDALEQQMHLMNRRLRWWRGLACGLVVLSLLSLTLPSGKAAEAPSGASANRLTDLEDKLRALEDILRHIRVVTIPHGLKEVVITRANLRIVNGLGSTDCTAEFGRPIPDCPNGLGNLLVGYNEPRGGDEDIRTGSHNVVVGQFNNFSRFGGVVVGAFHTISGDFASVSGGIFNTASGEGATVSGGNGNTASGTASSVSGGSNNTASGQASAVSGGQNITQETEAGWSAGSEAEAVVVGNVRSP
jgi:hypothetical protein